MKKKYGLVGKKLSYSFSKIIHEYLFRLYKIDATYELIEVNEVTKDLLLQYDGLNITIPFKEDVLVYLDEITKNIQTCNTIHNDNMLLKGYDTDTLGFDYLVQKLTLKKLQDITILGSGAMSKMLQSYFKDKNITIISRQDDYYNYDNILKNSGDLLINATPIGMGTYQSPISVAVAQNYQAVIDLNYNPICSALYHVSQEAERPFINGLYMLVVQAIRAFEIWQTMTVPESVITDIYNYLLLKMSKNIAIIGMPLSGKTTFIIKNKGIDLDDAIIEQFQQPISEMLVAGNFRTRETTTLQRLVDEQTPLLALGGGAILKPENMAILKDYTIIHLHEKLNILQQRATYNFRPLIKNPTDVERLYQERIHLYQKYAMTELNDKALARIWDESRKN